MKHWEGPRQERQRAFGRLVLTASLSGMLFASFACGGSPIIRSKDGGGGVDAGWQTGFAAALTAQPLYSIGFLDQGPILSMDFVSGGAGTSCAALTSATLSGGDTWTVGVIVPSTSLGPYEVLPPSEPVPGATNDAGATVYLEHSNPGAGLKLVAFASGGVVTISAAPALASDQEDGGRLVGSFTYVAFPTNPIAVGSCQGTDGGAGDQPQVCTCEDLFGNLVSTCDGGPACCVSSEPATISISPTFDAGPCAALCVTGPDISPTACGSL